MPITNKDQTMYQVSAADIKKLRTLTGAGMMDCKKALSESEGDFEKAVDVLRKKGQKVAAKRADRDSSEGVVLAKTNENNTLGYLISLNCETDFVAKNEDFIRLGNNLLNFAFESNASSLEEFLKTNFQGQTVEEKLTEQIGVIGEKIEIQSFQKLESNFVGSYIHANKKIASLIGLSEDVNDASVVAKDLAMQVAAMNPISLDRDSTPQESINRELEVGKELAIQEGKPEELAEKIAQGRLNKFFKENTLVAQSFIKDGKQSVEQYVKTFGSNLKITDFKRYSIS